MSIVHPDGRIAWAAVGWAGELGVVTGVNADGIAVAVEPARTADVRPTRSARPVALLARAVLEQADTLDAAIKLVEGTPTLGAAVFVLVDGASGKWVIVERTPGKAIVERAPKQPAIGDVLTTNALAQDPDNDRARRLLASGTRVDRAARLVRAPLPDVAAVAALLRDTRGVDDSARPPGHRGVIDDGRSAHVAIIDPATLELWVADPRAGGRMRGVRPPPRAARRRRSRDAAGGHRRPTPRPTRIGPRRSRRARAALRDARDALARGDRDRAAEAVFRARTLAPLLPEAIELDAQVAQARGDDARAKQMYQQWLDSGADDPAGEERAKAALAR